MMLTLLAYKPNSSDYCRGCHMASYDSDFQMIHSDQEIDIIDFWGKYLFENKILRVNESGYEFTFLIDGVPCNSANYWDEMTIGGKTAVIGEYMDGLEKMARDEAEKHLVAHNVVMEQIKERQEKQKADKLGREELNTLATLKKKYEGDRNVA